MQSIKIRAVIALVLAAASVFSLPVFAADSDDPGAGDSPKTQPADRYTDKQLRQFVKAQANVQTVIKKWDSRVADADVSDKQAVRKKENKAMVKAVKASGLTPQQYNNIVQQAQQDPELTQRIQSFMTPR
ncbi:DUF4168 domain-containing protein [Salinisphaera sp.]|uniref:DUF4168 domain-containing protein n=1 Tax=Salinisphaera sp. TaxID=1914330 RepID=UPI002D79AF42|nr:DUF4168 domain-containing protein [Salinisphaera sp.]HET7314593.1 DUF4168 domain-containing protein [Salinisphaera sp.]